MYEIACNSSGLCEGRKPIECEQVAREMAQRLANERQEAFQLWDQKGLIDLIEPA